MGAHVCRATPSPKAWFQWPGRAFHARHHVSMGKNDNLHQRTYNPAAETNKKRKAQGKTEKFQGKGGVKKASLYRVSRRSGPVPTQSTSALLVGASAALLLVALVLYIVTSFTNEKKQS